MQRPMKWLTVVLLVCSAFLISCSQITDKVKNNTAMDTAKSMIQAMIEEDTKALTTIVPDTSPTDSPGEMLMISKNLGMSKLKMKDVSFKKDKHLGNIIVSFKDSSGNPVKWDLYFRKYGNFYTFGQFISGRTFKNDTYVKVAKAYIQGILQKNLAFLAKVFGNSDKRTSEQDLEFKKEYGISQLKPSAFKYEEFEWENKEIVNISFTDIKKQKRLWQMAFDKTNDGY